ncbi:hypothetical protein FUA23_04040 [Neolewinella aurantiaca]|uniref:Uncharacterized protein n=1 Tax=Neolewinella aurantiaca TaxID=2602767 RepID=A0A5C7FX13_9BACT|nr:YtxH domain-containing protein [Neolewinella aurantiaca]TXF90980.1 hypothetical protein FUA23_04040 [Neolewinella aurantiaca]
MNNYSNDNSKGWALGFGLLAGIAIGYYLNSNEGRAARRKAAVRFDEYGNQITEYGQQVSQQVSERATALADDAKTKYEEGKNWAGETADSLKSTINQKTSALKSSATETVNSVEESFKRGVDKAKTKVNATKA